MKRDRKAEEKIVNVLLDNAGQELYLSQLAQTAGTAISTTHQILQRKATEDFVCPKKLGNLSLYTVNPQDPLVRQMKIKRTIEKLRPLLKEIRDFSQKIVLFGSAAHGKDEKASDIDLFVLSADKDQVVEIVSRAKIGRKIQLVVKNFLEWSQMKKEDKFFWEEIKKGIVLWEERNERV